MEGGPRTSGQSVRLWRATRSFLRMPRGDGFSIVEVMVVLAVTGALFLSAAILIAGKQNQTGFDQAIRQVQSQIQQTMTDVSTGFFPNNGDFTCTAGGAGPIYSAGAAGQGTNSGCIFLGKAMQFQVAGSTPEKFAVYTIAGLQQGGASSKESANLTEAKPMLVAQSTTHSAPNYPDNSKTDILQNGLTTARMWYNNGAADVNVGAVAFISCTAVVANVCQLAQYGGAGNVTSGTTQVHVVPIAGSALGQTQAASVEQMNTDGGNSVTTSPADPTANGAIYGGVFLCFSSAGTDQYGIIRIGGDNRATSVTLTIKRKNGAACTYP